MLKRVVVWGAVLLVGSWAVARTDVGSYCKTLARDAFASAKKNVPIDFEIRVAEEELAKLDQVDDRLISAIASEMVATERKQKDLDTMQANLATKKQGIRDMYAALKIDQNTFFFDGTKVSRSMFELELEKACKNYKIAEGMVSNTQKMLGEHQERLNQAKTQRDELKAQKVALDERIQKLKTDVEVLRAAEIRSKRCCGDTQVAELERLKNRLDNLETRVHTRMIEVQLRDEAKPAASVRASTDIVAEAERILADEKK